MLPAPTAANSRWDHGGVDEPPDDQETVTSWTHPWIAGYKRRQAMLMATNAYKNISMLRELNLTSYAFSRNAQELEAHVVRFPAQANDQPFDPDIGDPYSAEMSRLLLNTLAAASSLISGQRAVLRDVWPKIGGELSEFEQGEYTTKRLEVFETDEAELLVELRNYSQHKFLPRVDPTTDTTFWSKDFPIVQIQFWLDIKPLLAWDGLTAKVRTYLESQEDSISLVPIISRYSESVREFYKWFWLKVKEKMKPERVDYDAHAAELMAFGEEVFFAPDWVKEGKEQPPDWNGARWRRRSLAGIRQKRFALEHKSLRGFTVDSQGVVEVGDHPWTPILLRVP